MHYFLVSKQKGGARMSWCVAVGWGRLGGWKRGGECLLEVYLAISHLNI